MIAWLTSGHGPSPSGLFGESQASSLTLETHASGEPATTITDNSLYGGTTDSGSGGELMMEEGAAWIPVNSDAAALGVYRGGSSGFLGEYGLSSGSTGAVNEGTATSPPTTTLGLLGGAGSQVLHALQTGPEMREQMSSPGSTGTFSVQDGTSSSVSHPPQVGYQRGGGSGGGGGGGLGGGGGSSGSSTPGSGDALPAGTPDEVESSRAASFAGSPQEPGVSQAAPQSRGQQQTTPSQGTGGTGSPAGGSGSGTGSGSTTSALNPSKGSPTKTTPGGPQGAPGPAASDDGGSGGGNAPAAGVNTGDAYKDFNVGQVVGRLLELHPDAQALLDEAAKYKMGVEPTTGALQGNSYDYDKKSNNLLINTYRNLWPFRVNRSVDDQAEALYQGLQRYVGNHSLGDAVQNIYKKIMGPLIAKLGANLDIPEVADMLKSYAGGADWLRVTGNILQVDIQEYAKAAAGILTAAAILSKLKFASAVQAAKKCFPAGTPVATEDGSRPIEKIVAGERVWAFDLISGEWRLCRVLQTFRLAKCEPLSVVGIADEVIESTMGHPFWVESGEDLSERPEMTEIETRPKGAVLEGRWVFAVDLRVGDQLLLRDGRRERVQSIGERAFEGNVYNFSIADLECFTVGFSEVLVHNQNKAAATNTGPSSTYRDVSLPSSVPNRATNATKASFESNLIDQGWMRSVSKDGKVTILQKNGEKYILRDGAKSTGGPTADFYKAGSKNIDLKIRLEDPTS